MGTPTYHLYIDDSGTRYPSRVNRVRNDGLDYFALGGLLIPSERVAEATDMLSAFAAKYELAGPLHSSSIRVMKGIFAWLGKENKRAEEFYSDLTAMLCSLPCHATACVIHRPGYNQRYERKYGTQRWDLCKSAYPIVVERAAKFAIKHERRLMVYVEQSGRKEDRAIKGYHSDIRASGLYFDAKNSQKYEPLEGQLLGKTLFSEPSFVKKGHPMMQLSDVLLYPLIKGGYDAKYPPYLDLRRSSRVIDDVLTEEEIPTMGVKYYCFGEGGEKEKGSVSRAPSPPSCDDARPQLAMLEK